MYTIDKQGNTYSLIDCSKFRHNGSLSRHKKECFNFCRYSIDKFGFVSHWVFGTDFVGVEGLQRLKLAVNKLQRLMNKEGLAYIMVFEEGEKSKHWHIHCLIDRYINIDAIRCIWERATKIKNVHINVSVLEPEKSICLSNDRLANYINKSLLNYPGERFFRKSNNVSTLISPYMVDNDKNVKVFLGLKCEPVSSFDEAVDIIAALSGYDRNEILRRIED